MDKRLINESNELINDDRLLRMMPKPRKKPFSRRNYLNAKPKTLYWYFRFKSFNTMKLVIAIILLLSLTATAQNCKNCKPAIKIGTCPDYHCYHCGNNEILNIQSLNCDCIDGYYRVNGQCERCPEGYVYDEITQWCLGSNPCAANQILVDGVCICQPGLIVIQNICQRCPIN